MKTEFLKELGLSQEQIDKVMAENGKDIKALQQSNDDLKLKAETAEKERDGIRTQLDEANKQIDSYKELDIETIKKNAIEWQKKYEEGEKTYKADIEKLKFSHALDSALSGTKAKDKDILKSLLKTDDLKLTDDGKILGLEDQIEAIKKDKQFLFDSDNDKKPQFSSGGTDGGSPSAADDDAVRAIMGLPPRNNK